MKTTTPTATPVYEAYKRIATVIVKRFPERVPDRKKLEPSLVVVRFNDNEVTTPQEVFEVCQEAKA